MAAVQLELGSGSVKRLRDGEEEAPDAGDKRSKPNEFKNPNDWRCPTCGDHVFASRPACRRCGATKPAGTGPPTPSVRPAQSMRAGDWNCPACGDHNYASRFACRKCHAPKPGMGAAPGGGGYGGGGPGGGPGGGYGAPGVGAYGGGGGAQYEQGVNSYSPYGGTPPSYPGMQGMGGGYGDQMGGQMGGQGYGGQAEAYGAYGAGGDAKASGAGYGGAAGGTPSGHRPGDWNCPSCGEHCYASRNACRKCQTPKPGMGGGPGGGMGGGPGGGMGGGMGGTRPGDWSCPNCGEHCFGSRSVCRKCNTPKPDGAGGMPGAPATGGSVPGLEHIPNARAGDWLCPSCSNHNYASRSACFKCQAPKP